MKNLLKALGIQDLSVGRVRTEKEKLEAAVLIEDGGVKCSDEGVLIPWSIFSLVADASAALEQAVLDTYRTAALAPPALKEGVTWGEFVWHKLMVAVTKARGVDTEAEFEVFKKALDEGVDPAEAMLQSAKRVREKLGISDKELDKELDSDKRIDNGA